MIDTKELRQSAQAATPGPWMLRTAPTSAGLCHIISAADWRGAFIYGDGLRIGVDDSLPKAQELAANARLIAAANPAAISELLDRLEAAEADALEQSRLNGMGSEREAALMAKLEAAERERDECNRRRLEAADHFAAQTALMKKKCDALRARIEAMVRQEPVAWARKLGLDVPSFGCVTDLKYRPSNIPESSYIPLYTLPGAQAQPAPSVPDGWLRAIDEALVTAHIGGADENDTYEQAKAKLDNLIGFHTDVATDPAVNGGWKLMPAVSTCEMDIAGASHCDGYLSVAAAVWDAMFAAAPEANQ